MRREHRIDMVDVAKIRETDNAHCDPTITERTTRTHGGDTVDEFRFAHRREPSGRVRVVHGMSLDEDRGTNIMTHRHIGEEILKQIPGVAGAYEFEIGQIGIVEAFPSKQRKAFGPQVMMRIDDWQVRL